MAGGRRVVLVFGVWGLLVFVVVFGGVLNVPVVGESGTIYIRADGSIDPHTASISTVDNVTYTLNGNINDSVVIERSNIVIDGNGSVVQGAGSGNGLYLLAVNNVTIKKTNVEGFEYGFYLNSSSHNMLCMSNIANNSVSGVELNNSSQNGFVANNILNNQYGIWIGFSSDKNTIIGNNITNNSYSGVELWSSNNTVSKNNIKDNSAYGVFFGYYPNNTVSGNNITNSWVGLYVDSPNNTISGNNIASNGHSGVSLYSSNNKIFHNNFINNPYQASNNLENTWDDGYPSGGNYWSDYTDGDLYGGPYQNESGSDGIGDTPYVIYAYYPDYRDRYPLMSPWPSGPGIHDLEVALKSPPILSPNTSTLLETTVSNNGIYNKTNVNLSLFINETLANSANIPLLQAGASYTLSYFWTPTIGGINNVTAYAAPVFEEVYSGNNRETSFVIVRYPIILKVPYDYSTIQEAIDAISPTMYGDTIQVATGTYYENIKMNKNYLTLVGESLSTTIIDGSETGDVVTIVANNVTICNFTIQHSGYESGILLDLTSTVNITRNNIINNWYGVRLDSSTHNIIQANNITNNGYYGIYLAGSSSNSIVRNNITANNYGAGISLQSQSNNNTLFNNNSSGNGECGITIDGSSYNMLRNNIMKGNRYNFGVRGGSDLSHYIHDLDTSNTVDGKSIYYLLNQSNLTISNFTHPEIGYLAVINSYNVTVEGLELRNNEQGLLLAYTTDSLLKDNNIKNNSFGIHLIMSSYNIVSASTIKNNGQGVILWCSSDHNTISENNVIGSSVWGGIWLDESSHNTISNNNITSCYSGVTLSWHNYNNTISCNNIMGGVEGVYLHESSNNLVSENNISNNTDGVEFSRSSYNNLSKNALINNTYSVHLYDVSSFNNIFENNITNNMWAGIYFSSPYYWDIPSDNKIYHNNFIDNTHQVWNESGFHDIIINSWDDSYPSGGNYWRDYTGQDSDGDGIGDSPYIIDENNQDRYPLMSPYGEAPEDIIPPTTIHDYDGLWHIVDFIINLTATDNLSDVAETYYRINDGPIQNVTANGQPLITTEGANNMLEYWSVDNADNEELPHNVLTGIKLDKTKPTIETLSSTPDGDVPPDQPVIVSVNVTDTISQVKNVILHYTLNNGTTWETPIPMNPNPSTNLYEATIPGQPAETWVRYKIIAYDHAGNNATLGETEPYCVYLVIPEFPQSLILPLFIITTLLAAIFYRRKQKPKREHLYFK